MGSTVAGALAFGVLWVGGCARGRLPPEPLTCPSEVEIPVRECVTQRFVEEGNVGWRLNVQAVIDTCVEQNASIPCDAGPTCPPDASVVVTPESWPDVCDTETRERFDPDPVVETTDVPPGVSAALEEMRAACPTGTCRLAVSARLIDFGERPSVLQLDSAVQVAASLIQAPQTWELHIGTILDRSLTPAAIDTVLEPFGMSGTALTQTLVAQSGQAVQFARYERLRQDRRERVVQHAIITLARRADVSLMILVEVDLTET